MPPNQESLVILNKAGFGDLVHRDAYIRHRAQTVGAGSVIHNDYYTTDGTTATLLSGETITYNAQTNAAAYHIFSKSAAGVLDTSGTANATISISSAKSTLRSTTVEMAGQLNVLGAATMTDVTATTLTTTTLNTLGDLSVSGNLTVDTSTLSVNASVNRVGVATTTPQFSLDVAGDTNLGSGNVYRIGQTSVLSSTTLGSGVTVSSLTSVGVLGSLEVSGNVRVDTNTFFVNATANRVGIGTTAPTRALDVVGSTQISGNLNVTGLADVYTGANYTWTSRVTPADNNWRSIVWGDGKYVAVSSTGTGDRVMTSPDGITWTLGTNIPDNAWWGLAYANGLYVATAVTGSGNRVMTSTDGITWTSRSTPANNEWREVTWGKGLFVAVSLDGSGNRVMTSPDGVNWTTRQSAADNFWQSVTFGNGLFVAVAWSGDGNRVMTSPDGIIWTIRSTPVNNEWRSVTWGNGLFVAVAASGTSERVMTSPDGITWTARTSAADNGWWTVKYGGGLFVAAAISGSGNRVMTSPDGITWTLRQSAANNEWRDLEYHDGRFVAVSWTGVGNRVMTWDLPTKNTVYFNADSGLVSKGSLDAHSVRVSGLLNAYEEATISGNVTIDSTTLSVDAYNNRVGVLTTTPQYPLDVSGNVNISAASSYLVGGTPVLSATSLGTTIASAPGLTSIGALSNLLVTGSFTSQSNVDFTSSTAGFNVAGPSLFSNDLTVSGNLTVNGTTTYLNTTTLQVDDRNIELGIDTASLSSLDGAGITLGSVGIATRPIFEYTYNGGTDYWKSNIGVRAEGATQFSAFEKDGTLKVAQTDLSGNFLSMDNDGVIFSDKWRMYFDSASDDILLQYRATPQDAWQTKFTFAND